MKALVWDGTHLSLADQPEPELAPGHAIVRVELAGICNTDLEIVRGYMGYVGVPGHELVGVVEQGSPAWRGKRVVAEINASCGQCPACLGGLERHCPHRSVLGIAGLPGAFAERVRVPERNLHEVPGPVPDEAAVFCEPLAAAFEILEQVEVRRGARAVVLGDGKLGLLVAMVLARAGADVQLFGRHRSHVAIVEPYGVEGDVLPAATAPQVAGEAPGPGGRGAGPDPGGGSRLAQLAGRADLVVEATGSPEGLALALPLVRPRGTLVVKSTVADPVVVDLAPLVVHEVTLVGSRCGPFEPALAVLASGAIDPRPLISARYPLRRGLEAFERARSAGALKVLLEMG